MRHRLAARQPHQVKRTGRCRIVPSPRWAGREIGRTARGVDREIACRVDLDRLAVFWQSSPLSESGFGPARFAHTCPPQPRTGGLSVNALLLVLAAALAADPEPVTQDTFFNAESLFDSARGQNPGSATYDDDSLM